MRGLLVVVLLAGCTGVAAAPAPAVAPPGAAQHPLGTPHAIPGESMVYEITFRGLRAGRVQVAVGQAGWFEGRPAIIVKSRGETEGLLALIGDLDWQLETTIDLERGTPLLAVEEAVITFRGKTKTHTDRSTSTVHNVHSTAAVLRGWRSAPGQRGALELRIDVMEIDVDLHEAGRDVLAVPAVRYEGVARTRFPFKIWISDDAARVPLRLQTSTRWGEIVVELVEYHAPKP